MQLGRPRLSCFFPAFNEEANIGPLLDEAVRQLPRFGQTFEIVVVDDGSTDDSRAIIGNYGSRVIPVFKANGGQGSAFN